MSNLFNKIGMLVSIFMVVFTTNSFSQNELWYFGNGAGMAFTGPGNSPVSRPGEAAVGFYESLTTIGDGNGNVQWYTNGIDVYDATHSIMPNGSGILGASDGGTGSANQGVLTMPFPGSTTKYIMWTVPATDGTPSWGMRYHVIDMTLNGGLGDVSSKNNLVSGGANVAEMLAGGRVNGNCNVMWAIAHETGSNRFIINKVDQTGGVLTITTNTQAIGPVVNGGGSARGAMDISPDGTKIALCGGWPTGSHMFDFNATTGVISNPVDLGPKFVPGNQWRYGVFFSPDSRKIYFANGSYGVSPKLVQYNITLDALTTVYNGGSSITEFAQGKDGVLYVGKTTGTSLAIMNNPDASTGGATGFVNNGYPLGGGSLNFGLPQYTYCFLDDPVCPDTSLSAIPIPNICVGGSVDLSTYQGTALAGGTWSISNGPAGYTSSIGGTTFNSVESGTYTVRYTLNPDPGGVCPKFAERSLVVDELPSVSVNNVSVCDVGVVVTFTASSTTATGWVWSGNGSGTNQTTTGSAAGNYTVTVTDGSCSNTATGVLTINPLPTVSVNDATICFGDPSVTFTATSPTATGWVWSNNGTGTNQTTTGTTAGNYTVTVTDGDCSNTATGTLTVNPLPNVSVNDATICATDPPATFTATSTTATGWVWSNNGTGTNQTTTGSTAGNYTVTVTDGTCSNSATGVLTVDNDPLCGVVCPDTTIGGSIPPQCVSNGTIDLSTIEGGKTGTWVITSGPVGATITGGNTFNINNISGDYVLTFQIAGAGGLCDPSPTRTIRILELPTVSVNDVSICVGDPSATFTATSTTATGWIWSNNGTGINQTTTGSTAGNYTVTVTDGVCSSLPATGVLTINNLPIVTVNSETICSGDPSVTFTANSDSLVSSYTWSDNGTGTNQTTNGSTQGDYTVTIVDINGCSNSTTGTLTVNDLPNVSVNDETICIGDPSVTFTATSTTATGWVWSDNGTGTNQTTNGVTEGDYTVTVTDGVCSNSATGTLTINPLPIVTVNNETICSGDGVVTFTATSTTATGWVWSDNGTGTDQTTTGIDAGDYTVNVVDVNGCSNSATGTLTINPLPSVSVNSETICIGDPSVTFTATSTTATGWVWSNNGTGTNQTTTGSIDGNYTVVVTDGNCSNTATGTLTVNPLPSVSVNNESICIGDPSVTFTATSTTATGWIWSGNGTGNSQTTNGITEGDYVVTVTDGTCSNTATGTLTINDLPIVDLGNDFNVCEGDTISISIGDYKTILWSDGSNGSTYKSNKSEKVYVTVTDINGCRQVDSVVTTLVPKADGFSLRGDTTICEKANDEVLLFVDDDRDIIWQDGSSDQNYIAITYGEYIVSLTDGNGCVTTDTVILTDYCPSITLTMPNIFTPTGDGINDYMIPIEMEWADKDFMMANILNINFHVYNRWGLMIHSSEGVLPRWNGRSVNGLECSDGTYFWILRYNDTSGGEYKLNGFVKLYRAKR